MSVPKIAVENFEDFCHKVFTQRYGFKTKIKQTEEEFLLGVMHDFKKDSWIANYKRFIGFDDERYHEEMLRFYIKLMTITGQPV